MEPANLKNIAYVFLDRDGVLNRRPAPGQFVTRCDQLELLPGVGNAVAKLNRSGRRTIVVTNQRGIALGLYSVERLSEIHDKLQSRLATHGVQLDAIYVCPHDAGQCNCRKPLTGLFEQAFVDFPAARADNSVVVGDSLRDIEAGQRLGMRTVFVDDGATQNSPEELQRARSLAHVCVVSLAEFVNEYLCRNE